MEILKGNRLTIFENKVVVDKNLPKWRRAEAGLNKTNVEDNPNSINNNVTLSEYFITNADNDPDGMSYSDQIRSRDIDRDINSSTLWLPLYEIAEGVSFDTLASAGIKDLTRLIAEKKLKFVIGGYGSFGNTQGGTLILNSNPAMDTVVSSYNTQLQMAMEKSAKNNIFNKIKSLFKKKESEVKEDEKYMDALQFFSMVKASSKESVATYRDRVSDYLKSIHNAVTVGQTALVEDLLRGLVTNKYESVLFAEGLYYVVNEQQMVSFVKQCEKGIKLEYVKNFTRPMPQDIVDKIAKINQLEVFDNYVVLYYDPDGKIYKETAREEAKRKDPIIFGVIAGSEKLYYVADWVDEYCDLTLEAFIDAIGVKKDELHMDYDPSKVKNDNNSNEVSKKKKKSKKTKKNN
jgi:hypothetical protein